MANSVDPDQTVPIRAVCSGSMLFACLFVGNIRQLFAADHFRRGHFQILFIFLGPLRVRMLHSSRCCYCFLIHQLTSHIKGKISLRNPSGSEVE